MAKWKVRLMLAIGMHILHPQASGHCYWRRAAQIQAAGRGRPPRLAPVGPGLEPGRPGCRQGIWLLGRPGPQRASCPVQAQLAGGAKLASSQDNKGARAHAREAERVKSLK